MTGEGVTTGPRVEPLLALVGPTGVGKTALAVRLAREWAMEVVSVDSRQVYRRMDIGTGKPTPEERAAVPHHLLDVVEPDARYDAARFARDAAEAIRGIRARGRLPVLVGGTGLYLRAFLRGLAPVPGRDPAFRAALAERARREGPASLHAELAAIDPERAARIHPHDLVRISRALEIHRASGEPPSRLLAWRRTVPGEGVLVLGLTVPRSRLYARLEARVEAMLARGLLEEVRGLLRAGFSPELPALQGIGYRHMAAVLAGRLPLGEAIRAMKRDTRRYAKRQWAWFAREPGVLWVEVEPDDPEGAVKAVRAQVEAAGIFP
ncbi:MAG: tRNA (adenosine(37)-N6)-dimethylallyltransferase MiaA [Candidatus Rokubacteria bacterium]|nr:tRNA (adenosine(37)-N6)-dimethylallyltransferase MiaA [Candidatus Rokubacteria bacterium]